MLLLVRPLLLCRLTWDRRRLRVGRMNDVNDADEIVRDRERSEEVRPLEEDCMMEQAIFPFFFLVCV